MQGVQCYNLPDGCAKWCTCRSMTLVTGLSPVPALVAHPLPGGAGSLKWVGRMQDQLVVHPSLDTTLLCSRGHILSHFGPERRPESSICLPIFLDHLKNETTQLTAVRALNTIARCLTKLQWKSTHPMFCMRHLTFVSCSISVLCPSCCVGKSCAGHSHLASSLGHVVRSPNCVDLSLILVSHC